MTRKQTLVILVLGVANCLVLGGLVFAMVLAPRLIAGRVGALTPAPTISQAEPSAALPPTWTPTQPPTPRPTATRLPTRTPAPTRTPVPIPTATRTPVPTPRPIALENAGFDSIQPDSVPGWEVEALVNWRPGGDFNPEASYCSPLFKRADDPRRFINGSTLQIECPHEYVKFRVTLYQTIAVEPGSWVQFEVKAMGYADQAGIRVRAGIDPHGGAACEEGLWGDLQSINQTDDVVTLESPGARVGEEGLVAVCFFAEPEYAVPHRAAFFDDALLLVFPPGQ